MTEELHQGAFGLSVQAFTSTTSGLKQKFNAAAIGGGLLLSFSLLLFGIKLWVIDSFGSSIPIWDQWDGEAARLYEPFLKGTLTWADLISCHNEHRILTARLLSLALLSVNGIWNPLLQMVANAIIHVGGIGLAIALLAKVIGRKQLSRLLLFSLVLFGVPYAYGNTLMAFQAEFYFLLLFSTASLWLTVTSVPLSARWWGGLVFGVMAFFSLASGIFALAAAAMIGILQHLLKIDRSGKRLLAIATLLGLFLLGAYLTLPHHVRLKAASVSEFYWALVDIFGWPIASNEISCLVGHSPVLVVLAGVLWKRPDTHDKIWFVVALIFWSWGQAISIAYGRGMDALASRYLDLFAIGTLVNFVSLLSIRDDYTGRRRRWVNVGLTVWVGAILVSLGLDAEQLRGELNRWRSAGLRQETNMKNYLATGDFQYLKGKTFPEVPHPRPERLAAILTSPDVRSILPSSIRTPLNPINIESEPAGAFVDKGYFPATPARTAMTLGSYGSHGSLATGRASMEFNTTRAGYLAIPIAGYALSSGINMEIEQGGRRQPLVSEKQPKGAWGVVYTKVGDGTFVIEVTDFSPSAWVAIGTPWVVGRLDTLTSRLLGSHFIFLVMGIGGILMSMLWSDDENARVLHESEENCDPRRRRPGRSKPGCQT